MTKLLCRSFPIPTCVAIELPGGSYPQLQPWDETRLGCFRTSAWSGFDLGRLGRLAACLTVDRLNADGHPRLGELGLAKRLGLGLDDGLGNGMDLNHSSLRLLGQGGLLRSSRIVDHAREHTDQRLHLVEEFIRLDDPLLEPFHEKCKLAFNLPSDALGDPRLRNELVGREPNLIVDRPNVLHNELRFLLLAQALALK